MKKQLLSIITALALCLGLLPTVALADDTTSEQFNLTPGRTYWFDLSSMEIPGTVNTGTAFGAKSVPDPTLHYVPFTYAGTVVAYKLNEPMYSYNGYAEKYKYAHSLFVADYVVKNNVSWDDLHGAGLVVGKKYTYGNIKYTMRTPSVGSESSGTKDEERGIPLNNEWDVVLNKDIGYIKNWNSMGSWGQDHGPYDYTISDRVWRSGMDSVRSSIKYESKRTSSSIGFRPFLEVLNADTLGPDGLKAVTLDLNGGKLGGSTNIQIVVKNGASFTAPASDGLTPPVGVAGSVYAWKGSDGNFYDPGDRVPAGVTSLTAQWKYDEQFDLTPGETYWFDLSGAGIPGSVNDSVPDTTLHYVPFTYTGAISAYVLNSSSDGVLTASEDASKTADQSGTTGYSYPHSLFVADYAITHTVTWRTLKNSDLIFGKNYTAGNLDYTMRAPSAGSFSTGAGAPGNNEWDAILIKDSGYIKNWRGMCSWGQDTSKTNTLTENRAGRGYASVERWYINLDSTQRGDLGFRPVLEILNPSTLGSAALKAVTLDLHGGSLGNSTDSIKIIVKGGEDFTAPAYEGLTRPDGNLNDYFEWLGSDGVFYAPGDTVPAGVTSLTAQWTVVEQFDLTLGGTYWFDLSGAGIPGTVNTGNSHGAGSVPDTTLHYVPFTYAGTVNAYNLTSAMVTTEEYAQENRYSHSLFVADHAVKHTTSWDDLNDAGFIFGKNYTVGGVDYTMHAPSAGSWYTGVYEESRGTPQCNEWDAVLTKDPGYIKNWRGMYSWGQDTPKDYETYRELRGYEWVNDWNYFFSTRRYDYFGFRPVLEVLNPYTLGLEGLKAVTLDLNGGKLGGNTDSIQIIVRRGADFTAPASEGLTRPDGNTGDFFIWRGSDGKTYAPGTGVPADVTALTALWTDTYTVMLHPNDGTIAGGKDVVEYTYGEGASLPTAADITRTGYSFEGWYTDEGFSGSPVTEISRTDAGNKEFYAKWKDDDDPTGVIKVGTNEWYAFFHDIAFDLFFQNTQTVTITASDTSGSAVTIGYLLSDRELGEEDLKKESFTTYTGEFRISPDNKYVIYAKLVDAGGNVTYLNSNGIVLDGTVPVISGVENGKTYCGAQIVTVTEEHILSVTKNGTGVTLDDHNQFILSAAEGTQTIVVTDRAGHTTTVTVTVNDGHTAGHDDGDCSTPVYCVYHPNKVVVAAKSHDFSGKWQSNGNGTHTHYCTADGCNGREDGSCTGGTATCTAKAKCEDCGAEYGELDSSNHNPEKISAKDATVTETGNKEYWHCLNCSKYFADESCENEIAFADTVIPKLTPEIIDGKGQGLTAGKKEELTFRSNAAFGDFIRVELDGETLDEKNYTVREGSTIVTLKADYAATLSAGEHTISIVSTSGTAATAFTVNAKTAADSDTESPQTGDSSHMALWMVLLFVSGGLLTVTGVYSKKKRFVR